MGYVNVDEVLFNIPDDAPYKESVKRILMQAKVHDDVEPVIHCKHCKHKGENWRDDKYFCNKMTIGCGVKFVVRETYFCGSGERDGDE